MVEDNTTLENKDQEMTPEDSGRGLHKPVDPNAPAVDPDPADAPLEEPSTPEEIPAEEVPAEETPEIEESEEEEIEEEPIEEEKDEK